MQPRAVARLAHLADDAAGVGHRLRGLRSAAREQREQDGNGLMRAPPQRHRACARAVGDVTGELTARRGDIVAARLARRDGEAGALQHLGEAPDALGEERLKPERGNGLNGIRLNLLRTFFEQRDQLARVRLRVVHASSITYSKVMKSRGAFSR